MSLLGTQELGRGVVVGRGQAAPGEWSHFPRVVVGEAELSEPGATVQILHAAWMERRPVVIELAADPNSLRAPEGSRAAVYSLSPGFEFTRERLHYLVWANNYDARSDELIWWHGRKAARAFARQGVSVGGPADIVLAEGTPLFMDGGPFLPPLSVAGLGVVHRWNAEAGSLESIGDREPSSQLAPDQLAAVSHRLGGARVIAPAGSGKTRVLTERIRHLVRDRRLDPGVVTALAFNTKAAEEMRQRCADVVGSGGPHIQTLNSVGLWICNEYGRSGRLRTIDEVEVRDVLQRLFEIRRQFNTDTVLPYIDALSSIRLGLTAPKRVEEEIPDAVGVADGFDRYRSALADAGLVDFDEQIYQAIEILITDPDARAAAQARCRLLLVDEFQDLNPAHMLLIRLLSAPAYNCFGVGDDDQVIYGYSGATPKFLIDFPTYFPGAGHHALEVNYRCPPAIVAAATHLLSYNRERVEKTIRVPDGRVDVSPESPGMFNGAAALRVIREPVATLAGSAVDLLNEWHAGGTPWEQMAILSRVNSSLLPVQVACTAADIPCSTPLDAKVLGRTGARAALAYLRIGALPERISAEDLGLTIRRPPRKVSRNVVEMLTKRGSSSLGDIRGLAGRLSGGDVSKLLSYADDLEAVARSCRKSTAAALRTVREEVGLGESMDVLDSSRREADRSTHADDLLALESVAALHPEASTFETWLREMLARPQQQSDVVALSTIHKMKGREWDQVIVFGASEGLLPHRLSDDEEGERRVFHVAITRARRQAVVLADAEAPSVFLDELYGLGRRTSSAGRGRERRQDAAGALRSRPRPAKPKRREPTVVAAVGLTVEHGGHSGEIVELGDVEVVVQVGSARVGVKYGSDVTVGGRTVSLVGPDAEVEISPATEGREKALRAWRGQTARRDKVPAYVVMNDVDLAGVASRCPGTLAELAACRGMGPLRLERYADEILAVLVGATLEVES